MLGMRTWGRPWVNSEQASKEMRLVWALKTGTELDKIFVFSASLEQCLKVIQLTEKNSLSELTAAELSRLQS